MMAGFSSNSGDQKTVEWHLKGLKEATSRNERALAMANKW